MTYIGEPKRILRVEPIVIPKELPIEKPEKIPEKINK